jgi:hypothetical protein
MDKGGTFEDNLTDPGFGSPSTDGANGEQGDASPPQRVVSGPVNVPGGLVSRPEDQSDDEILDVPLMPGRRGGGGRAWGGGSGGDGVGEDASFGSGGRGRRSLYATRDLTQGSVPKTLFFLGWPQVVEGLLNVVDQMADLFWAGRGVGSKAIAGLGVAQSYTQLIMTGRQGLDAGMQAMIARAIGAGRVGLANHVALQAFTLTGGFVV